MKRRSFAKALALAASIVALGAAPQASAQTKTVKVGVLHSLSGTMAISETVLKDVALMAFDEVNAQGGVMGYKIEPVVVDPASNWPLFAEKARQLLTQEKVAAVFGCWTSVSRKSVLPVFEELNGLLFYPVQYEGEEISRNVFYTGAAPNQQAIPAVEYLMSADGGGAKRWFLLGTDYVYPRTTNKILRAFLKSKGVPEKDIEEVYTPFGHSDYQTIVANVKKFSAGGKTAVVSTINGDSNVPFYKELGNQGLKATDVPVVAFSVGEEHQAAGRPPGGVELLHVDQEPGERGVHEEVGRLRESEGPARAQGQAADQRSDGGDLYRRPYVEAGGREGEELRRPESDGGHGRPDVHCPLRHPLEDGREEPSPLQGGIHRRSQGRRPVQRGVEDQGSREGAAVEPVHPGQRQEGR